MEHDNFVKTLYQQIWRLRKNADSLKNSYQNWLKNKKKLDIPVSI
jgi:hypothetical protein